MHVSTLYVITCQKCSLLPIGKTRLIIILESQPDSPKLWRYIFDLGSKSTRPCGLFAYTLVAVLHGLQVQCEKLYVNIKYYRRYITNMTTMVLQINKIRIDYGFWFWGGARVNKRHHHRLA